MLQSGVAAAILRLPMNRPATTLLFLCAFAAPLAAQTPDAPTPAEKGQ